MLLLLSLGLGYYFSVQSPSPPAPVATDSVPAASQSPQIATAPVETVPIEAAPKEVEVTYEVSGVKPTTITYINDQGGIEQVSSVQGFRWEKSLKVKPGTMLSISAQNGADYGGIHVVIRIDGKAARDSKSKGAYTIASCAYQVP